MVEIVGLGDRYSSESCGDYTLFLPLPLFPSLVNSAIDFKGVFSSCTIEFEVDLACDLEMGEDGILVDLI